jgi:hypothetical protein
LGEASSLAKWLIIPPEGTPLPNWETIQTKSWLALGQHGFKIIPPPGWVMVPPTDFGGMVSISKADFEAAVLKSIPVGSNTTQTDLNSLGSGFADTIRKAYELKQDQLKQVTEIMDKAPKYTDKYKRSVIAKWYTHENYVYLMQNQDLVEIGEALNFPPDSIINPIPRVNTGFTPALTNIGV